MTPLQALTVVEQIVHQARLNYAEHQKVQEAMLVLRNLTVPKPKSEKKNDEKSN